MADALRILDEDEDALREVRRNGTDHTVGNAFAGGLACLFHYRCNMTQFSLCFDLMIPTANGPMVAMCGLRPDAAPGHQFFSLDHYQTLRVLAECALRAMAALGHLRHLSRFSPGAAGSFKTLSFLNFDHAASLCISVFCFTSASLLPHFAFCYILFRTVYTSISELFPSELQKLHQIAEYIYIMSIFIEYLSAFGVACRKSGPSAQELNQLKQRTGEEKIQRLR